MPWTPRRRPSGHGQSIETQRTDTRPCGAPRPLSPCCPGARAFAATRPPPMAPGQTPRARVVPVLAALPAGGGSHAATRLDGGRQPCLARGPERLRGCTNPGGWWRAPTRGGHRAWPARRCLRAGPSRAPPRSHQAGPGGGGSGPPGGWGRGPGGARHASSGHQPGRSGARAGSTPAR
jgi:hypothetical protein